MNRIAALALATAMTAVPAVLIAPAPPVGAIEGVTGPAFTVEVTVMEDDGSDTCATDNHVVVDPGTTFRGSATR